MHDRTFSPHIRRWIRWARPHDAAEVEAGLLEEWDDASRIRLGRLRRTGWLLWQLMMIGIWGGIDRMRGHSTARSPRGRRPGLSGRLFRFKVALRSLITTPTFTITAMLTLALGIGATTVMFAIIEGFSRPIPVPEGDRIVRVDWRSEQGSLIGAGSTLRDLETLREARTLQGVSAYRSIGLPVRWEGGYATPFSAAEILPELFGILQVVPERGRLLHSEDRESVLLSHRAWTNLLGSDPEVLGRELVVDGRVMRVVGVMPDSFRFPLNQDLWIPLDPTRGEETGYDVFGRLAEGRSIRDAATEFETLGLRIREESDLRGDGARLVVSGFTENRGEGGEELLLLGMFSVVVLLLIVAVGNSAGVLLARGVERLRSYALHAAVGAGPRQIVSQSLTESLLLTVGAGAVGLGIAFAVVEYINRTISQLWGYFWMDVRIDGAIVLFTVGAVAATALLVGLIPAVMAGRADPNVVYRQTGGATGSAWGRRFAKVLLSTELAVSCVALVLSGLIVRGMLMTGGIPEEFPSDEIAMVSIDLSEDRYATPEARQAFWTELDARAQEIPAARVVSLRAWRTEIGTLEFPESTPLPELSRIRAGWKLVDPSFIPLTDLEVVRGRGFTDADMALGSDVAIVNQAFVNRFFPEIEPVGQRLRLDTAPRAEQWRTIVGVVTTSPHLGPAAFADLVYLPVGGVDRRSATLFVRTDGDTHAMLDAMRAVLGQIDPDLSPSQMSTYEENLNLGRAFTQTAGKLTLVGGLGSLAIAVVGLFGMLSLHFKKRTSELGLRMALGAGRREIARRVFRVGLGHLLPGLLIGFGFAFIVAPKMTGALYGISPTDPFVTVGVIGAFLFCGLVAVWIPARRAIRVDPVRVLKSE